MPDFTDYDFSRIDVVELIGLTVLPSEFRILGLRRYLQAHGANALVNAFSNFIGMTNSVVANNREMIELYLISECAEHPHTAEKINLPTIFGAMNGILLSSGVDQSKTCHGCAFRHGTIANQSPGTTCDAEYSTKMDYDFMCHENLDEAGEPTRKCIGYVQMKAKQAKE